MGSPKNENRVENQEEETTPSPPRTARKPKRCSPGRPDFHFVVCPKAPMMARSPDLFGEKQRVAVCTLDGKKRCILYTVTRLCNIYEKKDAMYNVYNKYLRIVINDTSYMW